MALEHPFFVHPNHPLSNKILNCLDDPDYVGAKAVHEVRNKPLSMLGTETLLVAHLFASLSKSVVLEVGAYVGGGTTVLLDAVSRNDAEVITIEEPVEHPSHPQIRTKNTVADLKKNISSSAGAHKHHLLAGCSFEEWVIGRLQHKLEGRKIDCLIWDADACFDRDLVLFGQHLAKDCMVVIDDYNAEERKSDRLTKIVDWLVEIGVLERVAFLPWATWIGVIKRTLTEDEVTKLYADWRAQRGDTNSYIDRLLSYRDDCEKSDEKSVTVTFADRMKFWRSVS